jgi:hypothetical protein
MFEEQHVRYLYKYLPFSEGSLKTIVDGTMKFTCPLDFNDPLDCSPYFDRESIENLHKTRPEYLKEAAKRRGMTFTQRVSSKRQMIASIRNKVVSGDFRDDFLRGVGVVSLSRNGLSPLMWSHYAKYHTGFVLEFRIPFVGTHSDVSKVVDRLTPMPVHYTDKRPVITLGVEDDIELLDKQLLTKSNVWEYEEEERVIDHLRKPAIYPYSRNEILSSVIAGMKIEMDDLRILENAVAALSKNEMPSLKLYGAAEVPDRFELTVPGHPRLDRDKTN